MVLEKSVLFFTHLDNMEKLITDDYILWLTLTGRDCNHPVVRFLGAYRGKISMNKNSIADYSLRNDDHRVVIGILIQIRISKHLEEWSQHVERRLQPPPLNDRLIIETVTNGGQSQNNGSWEVWSTTMSALERNYGESLRAFRKTLAEGVPNLQPKMISPWSERQWMR